MREALANSGCGLPVILREREASAGPFGRGTEIISPDPAVELAEHIKTAPMRDGCAAF